MKLVIRDYQGNHVTFDALDITIDHWHDRDEVVIMCKDWNITDFNVTRP